jgi:hypothetical protein
VIAFVDQDVLWLDVAVDEVGTMGCVQRLGYLVQHAQASVRGELAV